MEVEENKIKVEHNSCGLLEAKIGFWNAKVGFWTPFACSDIHVIFMFKALLLHMKNKFDIGTR